MYNDIPPALLRILEPVVDGHGLELVDAAIRGGGGRTQVSIVLDTPQGDGRVTADECAAVSREVGHHLDTVDLVPGAYVLEVSSPGVDRVLAREKDFQRVVGQRIALETRQPREGRSRFKGELIAFEGGVARIRTGHGEVDVPFADVRRAKAFYPFDALRQGDKKGER